MTYQRLSKPRFYMNNVTWLASRGVSRDDMITILSESGTPTNAGLNAGYTKYQIFDDNPHDYVTFDTLDGTDTDTVSVLIDFGQAIECNSISILNHDIYSSSGSCRVAWSATLPGAGGGTGVTTPRSVMVNGSWAGGVIVPAANGDTVATFAAQSARYWLVEFNQSGDWTTDLQIGEIVLGKYWTSPVSPDLPVNRSTLSDGVQVRQSVGGKSFGFASNIGASSSDYAPFRGGASELAVAGRETFDFSIGFIADTHLYPSDRADIDASDNFLSDVYNKTAMNLLPFVFACDSASTTEGDYLWARFDQQSFDSIRKGWEVESMNLRVVQEY
jgi:hypothetical protein